MRFMIGARVSVLFLLSCLLVVSGLLFDSRDQSVVTLSGNTPRVLQWARLVAPVASSVKMKAVVWLRLHNEDELDRLLVRQAQQGSPDYCLWLTPDQFAARFAPTVSQYAQVADYFRSQGLNVTQVAPNRLVLEVEGDAEHIGLAFGTDIYKYQYGGASFISNNTDPKLPAEIGEIVRSVAGLNNLAKLEGSPPVPATTGPLDLGPIGMTPELVATAYNLPNPNNAHHGRYTGKGRKIAIITAKGVDPSDLDTYWRRMGIYRDGKVIQKQVGGSFTGTHLETATDVELIGAQDPDADIIVYECKEFESTFFEMALNQMVTDNEADVVSISMGAWEDLLANTNSMKPQNAILKQAKAQGIAVFCSSGDHGAYDDPNNPKLSAHYPASDPNVVAVGGTTLIFNKITGERRETAWNYSGGAVSDYWAQPSWQYGPGVPANGKRNSCDVSFAGDTFRSAYAAYYNGRWTTTGATSAATPNWAALWLLCDQAAGRRIGDPNELIYEIGRSKDYASIFYDITVGNNGGGKGPGFDAGPGWDHATGWGSPNGAALVEWMRVKFNAPMLPDLPTTPMPQSQDFNPRANPKAVPALPRVKDPPPPAAPSVIPSRNDDLIDH